MYAYYLDKGHTLDSLLSLSNLEKIFYIEAMNYAIEMENEKYKALFGK
ncbi:hypothetical protein [Anaerosalibacter sp. Marseille-P3206]|nr:hypothetical protein [Anaerosalibacter sp. Marseille-P3206]